MGLLTECLARLQDKTVLFKYVLEEYCTVRRSYLVQTFIEALTHGGPDEKPPPIEHHAHDPQKYVGDMLAWLNQAFRQERDNVHLLLEKCNKNGTDISTKKFFWLILIYEALFDFRFVGSN